MEGRQLLAASIAEFPTQLVGGQPASIVSAPDGNLYFTLPQRGSLGSINPATHALRFYPDPDDVPRSLSVGPDGNIWLAESASIGKFDPATHAISHFPVADGNPVSITAGPGGNLWFTKAGTTNGLGSIDPTTGVIIDYNVPVAPTFGPNYTAEITSGPDGNLWMTSFGTDAIVSFNPTTQASAVYNLPDHVPVNPIGSRNDGLLGIAAGPDGNLWFTEAQANRVGKISPTSGAITEYFLPTPNSYPTGITAGPDGNLWFTEGARQNNASGNDQLLPIALGQSAVASISPATGTITTLPTPDINTNPAGIAPGPDGNLWFAEVSGDQIGEVAFSTPETGPTAGSAPGVGDTGTTTVASGSGSNSSSVPGGSGSATDPAADGSGTTTGGSGTTTGGSGTTTGGSGTTTGGSGATPAAPVPDGPRILAVGRLGYHRSPTTLVLAFDQILDPASATIAGNYQILGPDFERIRIASATYDPASGTVTLHPTSRLNLHRNYQLTASGATPGGIRNRDGLLLDGGSTGRPGSNFQAIVDRHALIAAPHIVRSTKLAGRPVLVHAKAVSGTIHHR